MRRQRITGAVVLGLGVGLVVVLAVTGRLLTQPLLLVLATVAVVEGGSRLVHALVTERTWGGPAS